MNVSLHKPVAGSNRLAGFSGSFLLPALASCLFSVTAIAQQIANPSFETPSLFGTEKVFVMGGDPFFNQQGPGPGLVFGAFAGICRQQAAYAARMDADEGVQVAFLQGDPTLVTDVSPGTPLCMMVIEINGLKTGQEYEIEWSQASRADDEFHGGITAFLADPKSSFTKVLVDRKAVENKDEWDVQKHTFSAHAPAMNLIIQHFIPNPLSGPATGGETTLLDNFQIREVKDGL